MKVKGMKVAQKAQIFFILLIVLIPLFSAASYGCLCNSNHIPMKKNSDVIIDFCDRDVKAWVDPNYIPIPPKKWEVLQSMYPRTWIDDFTNLDNYRHVNYSIAG